MPERFQFFLWTIVSSMGVLVLILASDPVTVTELPKLPDGMLYLMGLSSAGYLGGKLVRGPGPSIKSIDVGRVDVPEKPAEGDKPAEPACTILDVDITGDNLSPDATFQLDDERIPAAQVHVADRKVEGQDARFCSMLKVELKNVAERYFDGPHLFRIINPDSQGADIKYGTKLDSVGDLKAGDVPVLVTVTGTNFKDPSSAEWKDAAKTVSVIDAKQVTKKTDTQLEITLTPGPVGKGTLTIKSPKQLKTSIEVIVGAGSETPPQPDATVESVSPIQAGDQPVQVTVTGANFKDSSEAVWTDAAGTVTPVPAANITKKSDTELEITLTPGNAGPATLEIKSPGGLTTTVDVTVE